jgi:hypothetical protein
MHADEKWLDTDTVVHGRYDCINVTLRWLPVQYCDLVT